MLIVIATMNPCKGIDQPDEVATTFTFLAIAEYRHVNHQVIKVNGRQGMCADGVRIGERIQVLSGRKR